MSKFGIPVRNGVSVGVTAGMGTNSLNALAQAILRSFGSNASSYPFSTLQGAYQTSAGPAAAAVNDPIGLELDAMGSVVSILAPIDQFTFTAAGSTPPTTNSADTFLGENCVSVTIPINAGGYGVCRAVGYGSSAQFNCTDGKTYKCYYTYSLSRALVGGESVHVYTTGAYGGTGLTLTSSTRATLGWMGLSF